MRIGCFLPSRKPGVDQGRWAISLVFLSLLGFLGASSARGDSIYFRNLFANPGAEGGAASPDGQTVVPVPGWTTQGNFTVVGYGTPGPFPTPQDPGPSDRGLNFFAGGPDNASSSASQTILVPPGCEYPLDYGVVFAEARAFLGGFADEEDHAVLDVTYRDAQGGLLAAIRLGPVTVADRNHQTGLRSRSYPHFPPVGTRRIDLVLTMTRVDGTYNNACADELILWFSVGNPVEPATWGAIKARFEP